MSGLLGGDLDKAEAMFRKGLEIDPKFTVMRVGLAKTLIKKGRIAEARQEVDAVLNEKEPRGTWPTGLSRTPKKHVSSRNPSKGDSRSGTALGPIRFLSHPINEIEALAEPLACLSDNYSG